MSYFVVLYQMLISAILHILLRLISKYQCVSNGENINFHGIYLKDVPYRLADQFCNECRTALF